MNQSFHFPCFTIPTEAVLKFNPMPNVSKRWTVASETQGNFFAVKTDLQSFLSPLYTALTKLLALLSLCAPCFRRGTTGLDGGAARSGQPR